MKVTIFGSATVAQDDPLREQAYHLGALLAKGGHTVITGGYTGTMEAASRGAVEAGGHTIGVTCTEIERFRPLPANAWVKEEIRRETLTARLETLMEETDAFVALPGGPGTLTEISLAWNRLLIGSLPPKPLILVGPGWKDAFEAVFTAQEPYIQFAPRALLTFAPTVDAAAALLT